MNHKEFTARLCHLISNFCEDKLNHDTICFCGCSDVAKKDMETGRWSESGAVLDILEDILKGSNPYPLRTQKPQPEPEYNTVIATCPECLLTCYMQIPQVAKDIEVLDLDHFESFRALDEDEIAEVRRQVLDGTFVGPEMMHVDS